MTGVPWLRSAAPFRDEQVRRVMLMSHEEIRRMLGIKPLHVSEDLSKLGCQAMLRVVEKARGALEVVVMVIGPDKKSVTSDGFTITPGGRVKPIHVDGYDD
jgi:hypothetical protein